MRGQLRRLRAALSPARSRADAGIQGADGSPSCHAPPAERYFVCDALTTTRATSAASARSISAPIPLDAPSWRKSRQPMKSPLHRYLNDMLYALKARAFYSSLALTTPDICGSIDFPSASVGNRYRDWLGAWCGMLHGNRGALGGSLSHSVYEREGSRTLSGQLSA